MTIKLKNDTIAYLIGGIGWAILFYTDWAIALGVFLAIWCNNIQKK